MGKLPLLFSFADAIISLSFVFYFKDNPEIDWRSYVAQGDHVLDGETSYSRIWGPEG